MSKPRYYDYSRSKQGKFPAPVRLSQRSIAWKLSDLRAWIESRQ
jgi:predicted DNA-binding transcriptional regulator AlpA